MSEFIEVKKGDFDDLEFEVKVDVSRIYLPEDPADANICDGCE